MENFSTTFSRLHCRVECERCRRFHFTTQFSPPTRSAWKHKFSPDSVDSDRIYKLKLVVLLTLNSRVCETNEMEKFVNISSLSSQQSTTHKFLNTLRKRRGWEVDRRFYNFSRCVAKKKLFSFPRLFMTSATFEHSNIFSHMFPLYP